MLVAALACGPGPRPAPEPGPAVGPVEEMSPAQAARAAVAPREPGPPQRVELDLAFPEDGAVFSFGGEAFLTGRIDAPFGTPGRVDAILVVDVSASTQRSARVPTDPVRARVRGTRPQGPDVTILRAELDSARFLLEDVDTRDTRLGVVAFSAADRFEPPRPELSAWTEVTLTRHRGALGAGIDRIGRAGAAGSTNMAAGLDRAIDELIGRGRSRPDPEAAKVVVFFTDGTPTKPHEDARDNELAVLRAAERAAVHGIRVFSFAVGPEALSRPLAAVEMARRTGGVFTPVRRARDLSLAVKSVRLSGLERFAIQNVTRGRGAHRLHISPDGRFDALVPLVPGRNVLRVQVVVAGVTAVAEREVHYAPGSARTFVPPELEARRTRLSRRGGRELDVAAGEEARRLAAIARDRERIEAETARQLRELTVDVASPPPPSEDPAE